MAVTQCRAILFRASFLSFLFLPVWICAASWHSQALLLRANKSGWKARDTVCVGRVLYDYLSDASCCLALSNLFSIQVHDQRQDANPPLYSCSFALLLSIFASHLFNEKPPTLLSPFEFSELFGLGLESAGSSTSLWQRWILFLSLSPCVIYVHA